MNAHRLEDWGPTPETPAGRPHLKAQVGARQEQRLAALPTGPKKWTRGPRDSGPKWLDQQAMKGISPKVAPPASVTQDQPAAGDPGPKQQIG